MEETKTNNVKQPVFGAKSVIECIGKDIAVTEAFPKSNKK